MDLNLILEMNSRNPRHTFKLYTNPLFKDETYAAKIFIFCVIFK